MAQAVRTPPRNALALAVEPPPGGGHAVEYKITGWGRWKTVVVPPNAYVVHTRRGADKPLHIGMGVSFRYNPYLDAFLVIPAAMQTIVINARCICLERQGILVQAYVQWIIDDIATAYRKLDFSDAEDPMRVVNVQLREQAEAAIKDKVATIDRKSTRLNSSHGYISYAVFCLKKKNKPSHHAFAHTIYSKTSVHF